MEKADNYIEDLIRYRPMAVAGSLIKDDNKAGGLEAALGFVGNLVPNKEDAEAISSAIGVSEESMKQLLGVYIGKYAEAQAKITLRELREFYADKFEKFYTPENLEIVDSLFDSDQTFGEVYQEYEKAQEIANTKTDAFSDEEKESAKKKADELGKIVKPIGKFEELEIEGMKKPYVVRALKSELNDPFKEADNYEGQEAA